MKPGKVQYVPDFRIVVSHAEKHGAHTIRSFFVAVFANNWPIGQFFVLFGLWIARPG